MKKRKGLTIKINLSNRWLYFLITLGILLMIAVGVWAATYSASGAGHPYTEISTCDDGEILQVVNGGWSCVEMSGGGAPSCTASLTSCANYDAAHSTGDGAWTLCPSNRPVMHGVRVNAYYVTEIQCCAISVTCS